MEDIRLKTIKWSFADRDWELCCNMNVLADVQEIYGGDLSAALTSGSMIRSMLDFLAAMLNDYADSQGWQIRYTGKDLGRLINWRDFEAVQQMTMDLVMSAVGGSESEASEEDSKN